MFPNLRVQRLYVYGIQVSDPFTLENIKGPPKSFFIYVGYYRLIFILLEVKICVMCWVR